MRWSVFSYLAHRLIDSEQPKSTFPMMSRFDNCQWQILWLVMQLHNLQITGLPDYRSLHFSKVTAQASLDEFSCHTSSILWMQGNHRSSKIWYRQVIRKHGLKQCAPQAESRPDWRRIASFKITPLQVGISSLKNLIYRRVKPYVFRMFGVC